MYPTSHVENAHKLIADAEIDMFEMYPVTGGQIYFKPDNSLEWLNREYTGLPLVLSGEKHDTTTSTPTPRLVIGDQKLDLVQFKGLLHDGHLDGARVIRHRVLLSNIENNLNIKETTSFRVKRVENYSRTRISLILSTFSGATSQSYPFRQYVPPAFPWVEL